MGAVVGPLERTRSCYEGLVYFEPNGLFCIYKEEEISGKLKTLVPTYLVSSPTTL
jgi:hypothetical protein